MFLPSTITLKFGDSGDFVSELQHRLVAVNCLTDAMVNGSYDGATVNAVRSFQGREGLHADGVAGPETLRRLNGVIAGDTGGGTPADEPKEAAVQTAPAAAPTFIWGAAPVAANPSLDTTPPPLPAMAAAQPSALEPVRAAPEPPLRMEPPPPPGMNQAPPTSLLGMLPPAPPPSAPLPPAVPPAAIPLAERPPLSAPANAHAAPIPPANPIAMSPPTAPAAAETAPAERPGLIGRTMQFANAMMQKLANYFEAKLPPSVLSEVKEIGVHMARNGVKEVPIPVGPEQQRVEELPGRSQEPIKTR